MPLREEVIPIHGIRIRFDKDVRKSFRVEPGSLVPRVRQDGSATTVELPPLDIHAMLVAEY